MQKIKRLLTQILLKKGFKAKAEKIILNLSQKFLLEYNQTFFHVLLKTLKKIRSTLKLKSYRVNGVLCKIPLFLRREQQVKSSLRLLCTSGFTTHRHVVDSLMQEIKRCESGQGELFSNRKKIFKLANQNKVFVNFR